MELVSWRHGQLELVWHQLEIGGNGNKNWSATRGIIWSNKPLFRVANIYVRDGKYRIDTAGRELSDKEQDSLTKHLESMNFTAMD